MKFEAATRFNNDFRSLKPEYQRTFTGLMPSFNAACENYHAHPGTPWPKSLRVSQLTDTKGIWEMTWSFAGPDGRATFEFIEVDGEPRVRWRRIGGHEVYRNP